MTSTALSPDLQSPGYLQGLNPAYRVAVGAMDGPVLELAGAGTVKTRVLTARLVHFAATCWKREGRRVRIIAPKQPGADFNDVVRATP